MTHRFFLIPIAMALLTGTAFAGDGPGGCALTGQVEAPTATCQAMRAEWREAMTACLQSHRVKAEAEGRGSAGHPISAPAARAQMLLCQRQAFGSLSVVE